MSKKNIMVSVAILLLALVMLGWLLLARLRPADKSIYDAIPLNSLAVFEANHTGEPWQKITGENRMWKSLLQSEHFRQIDQQIGLLDSVVKGKPGLMTALYDKKMALVLDESPAGFGFVFIVETGNLLYNYELQELIAKQAGTDAAVVERTQGDQEVSFVIDANTGIQFNFCLTRGLFIGSFDKELVDKSLRQLQQPQNLLSDPAFVRMKNTCGALAEGFLFINTPQFSRLVAACSAQSYHDAIAKAVATAGGWVALDLLVKPGELLLNGYIDPIDSQSSYVGSLIDQEPVALGLYNVLPFHTRILLHFGMSDFAAYQQRISNPAYAAQLEQACGFDAAEALLRLIDKEIAFGVSGSGSVQRPFFVAKLTDKDAAAQLLQQISASVPGSEKPYAGEWTQFAHINLPDFVPGIFGKAFSSIEKTHYCIIDQYLILANDYASLSEMVSLYKAGRTLDLSANFRKFSNNIADKSNLLLYVNLREGLAMVNKYLSPEIAAHLVDNQQAFREFEGMALQFSSLNGLIYCSFYLKHNPSYEEENLVSWQTRLGADMVGKPCIVPDHITAKSDVIVFDADNHIYLISPFGEILWKVRLSGPVISDVFTVDYYGNGKYQYLFNTANYLYLLDRNGNNTANYPIKLVSQATSGLTLFDYNNTGDYRLLVNCADKTVHNFTLRGKEVDGWKRPKSLEIVTRPVERLVAGGKDYIIITDINGNIRIVDRQGVTRISVKGNIEKARNSGFYINKTNSKGVLLTSDQKGQLLYVSSNGLLSTTDFGSYSPDHFFLYEDFDENNSVDFIFLDGTKLVIFDRFRNELFSHNFDYPITTKPAFINVSATRRYLGIVSEAGREIFLIDKKGNMIISSGLAGETPFAVGSLHDNSEINLVTGIANTVYNYLIY
ncbi:MAG: hypothetical protein KKD74_11990 [Bacteroidetes bacterium]|nr:hypothetical protein [Bacteroidota bacterium]